MNEEYNLGVDFDDISEGDNHIMSLESKANGMIGWMVRDFISKEAIKNWRP